MIRNNESLVSITNKNIKYYKDKNYKCSIGDIISINVDNMSINSHNIVVAICEICLSENSISFSKYNINRNRYGFYSCKKCSSLKRKKTNNQKYGVDYVLQRSDVREYNKNWMSSNDFRIKSNKTQIDKYGCLFVQTDDFKLNNSEKHKEIIKEKKEKGIYNCPLSDVKNKDLREKGMYEKYGSTYSYCIPEIKQKIQNTNLGKFGCISPLGNDDIRNKIKDIFISKYGVDNPFKSNEVQKLIREKNNEEFKSIDDRILFKRYKYKVLYLTYKNKECLIFNWNGFDYYDGEYIRENFKLSSNHNEYPTIDHKISILYGFKNNIDPFVIASIDNLCITKRKINSTKGYLNSTEFINMFRW